MSNYCQLHWAQEFPQELQRHSPIPSGGKWSFWLWWWTLPFKGKKNNNSDLCILTQTKAFSLEIQVNMIIKHKTAFGRSQPNSLFLHIQPSKFHHLTMNHKSGHKTPLIQLTRGSLQFLLGKFFPKACFQMQRQLQQIFWIPFLTILFPTVSHLSGAAPRTNTALSTPLAWQF